MIDPRHEFVEDAAKLHKTIALWPDDTMTDPGERIYFASRETLLASINQVYPGVNSEAVLHAWMDDRGPTIERCVAIVRATGHVNAKGHS